MKQFLLIFILAFLVVDSTWGVPNEEALKNAKKDKLEIRALCAPAVAKSELKVNNVRAMLLNGGDVWWDRADGRYFVPNISGAGAKPVNSIFAAAVWIGGRDEAGALKFAGKTYGGAKETDFWAGPLEDNNGQISASQCNEWDRMFEVTRDEVDEHKRRFQLFRENGVPYEESQIPAGVLNWPAQGNPYFRKYNNFQLPSTTASLAPYWDNPDYGNVGSYDPLDGDYPIIEVRGVADACKYDAEYQANPAVADQMIFWIYNDNGGAHSETKGLPIQMEVQVEAFAFATGDALNDMTFMRYKLINRAPVPITDCYFGWWVDADLGCPYDDYIGCDTSRSLVYYYNADDQDGTNGTICNANGSPVNTYGTKIPILGIDYFEGPTKTIDDKYVDIGMTAFMYYNNTSGDNTADPSGDKPEEWYNLLRSYWKNGRPLTVGGTGYASTGGTPTKYAFPSDPKDDQGWSMCTTPPPAWDRRTIQSTGPILLEPGKRNFLVVGVPWVPNQKYPCPPLDELRRADDICQGLFDNCFKIFDGPDAPVMDVIELDQKFVLALSYPADYNNADLNFEGYNPGYSPSKADSGLYKFEGYQLYQLKDQNAQSTLDDPSRARLVAQVDKKNNISKLYNWVESNYLIPGTTQKLLTPELKVTGENKGLRNVFEITEDLFATGDDKRLVNHKEYFYTVVAYATNNYKDFDPYETDLNKQGQKLTFARGRRKIVVKHAVPRPITDKYLNAKVGDGVVITRLDGQGNYQVSIDMDDAERDRIIKANIENNFDCHVTYKENSGPIQIKVYNPLDVKDGKFTLKFTDDNLNDNKMDVATTTWSLIDDKGNTLVAAEKFDLFNEKLIADYGISVFFNNNEAGEDLNATNGFISESTSPRDKTANPWLSFIADQDNLGSFDPINFIKKSTDVSQPDLDPKNAYEKLEWFPFQLALKINNDTSTTWDITPAPINGSVKNYVYNNHNLSTLNNVDIVFTDNKDLWSRCVVVETSNDWYKQNGYLAEKARTTLQLRGGQSISKDVDANGNPVKEDTEGFSWFPGYAVDVETGQRLNIFFGENSSYDPSLFGDYLTAAGLNPNAGRDMIWNPNNALVLEGPRDPSFFYLGAQHFIYVTNRTYDGCAQIGGFLKGGGNFTNRGRVAAMITWTALPLASQLKSYANGLIPAETISKLRVNNNYQTSEPACENQGMPMYNFEIKGKSFVAQDEKLANAALDSIKVVPNPYYAYSSYERNEISDVIKITNLPAKADVTIYSLDGKFIKHFSRNETPEKRNDPSSAVRFGQIYPDLEWDLKNSRGITVGSGVYLIHIKTDRGERVVKWVGAIRQLEISGF